ncbi:Ig-like domain-containing protein [Nocardioides caeni]|uniref:Ig-like domain repeat protein n=1 Tax=Nocardioides caeni TaxID=574700 RepID=A0A4S8NIE7_9ACTN|nr:Ig-like domain-containing protein [Nocardioides caeni]THV14809.1 Ig-like domain repeat protein [Nocardioides caeni]
MGLLRIRLLALLAVAVALVAGAAAAPAAAEDAEDPRIPTELAIRTLDTAPVFGELRPVVAELITVPKTPHGGLVQFSIDGVPAGEPAPLRTVPNVVSWVATLVVPTDLAAGDHVIEATFPGDDAYAPSTASVEYRVDPASTTTTLSAAPASVSVGDDVTLSAQVAVEAPGAGTPTGTMQFHVDGSPLGAPVALDGDRVTLTTDTLPAGDHTITATYAGDGNFHPSTSSGTTVSVAKRATTLLAQPALVRLSPLGLPLGRLQATLTRGTAPVPGAEVDFTAGSRSLCTATTDASGVATCAATLRLVDLLLSFGYTASYAGSDTDLAATARGGLLG